MKTIFILTYITKNYSVIKQGLYKSKWTTIPSKNYNYFTQDKYPLAKFRWAYTPLKTTVTIEGVNKWTKDSSNTKGKITTKFSVSPKSGPVMTKTITTKEIQSVKFQSIKNIYLSPSTDCESDNPKIKEWALKITDGKKTTLAKVRAIYSTIERTIGYDYYGYYSALNLLNLRKKVQLKLIVFPNHI